MIDYPDEFPLPENDSYSGVIDFGVVRTSVPSANASQIINNNSPTTEVVMTFKMPNDIAYVWQTWVLNFAYQFFNMPMVCAGIPDDITSVQRVRFISTVGYQKLGDDWSQMTVTAEIVPGDFLTAA